MKKLWYVGRYREEAQWYFERARDVIFPEGHAVQSAYEIPARILEVATIGKPSTTSRKSMKA